MDARRVVLLLQAGFVATSLGWRSVQQRRRTGSSGLVLQHQRGPAAAAAAALMASGVATLVAGTARRAVQSWTLTSTAGIVSMLAGTGLTLTAQQAMGAAWRVGVNPHDRTDLVTHGLFRRVRNPVFSGMILVAGGSAVAVPNRWTGAGLAQLTAGILGQVLLLEEPHLRRQHGQRYIDYAAATGRFLPKRSNQVQPRKEDH